MDKNKCPKIENPKYFMKNPSSTAYLKFIVRVQKK
jgi:hypothetical protein